MLAVTATGRDGEDLADALGSLLGPRSVAFYPSWETLPHERLSPRADTVGRRLAILRRLAHPEEYADGPTAGGRRAGAQHPAATGGWAGGADPGSAPGG